MKPETLRDVIDNADHWRIQWHRSENYELYHTHFGNREIVRLSDSKSVFLQGESATVLDDEITRITHRYRLAEIDQTNAAFDTLCGAYDEVMT